jgi:hypothetical protein
MKTISSFSPGVGKRFIGKYTMQLCHAIHSHFALFHDKELILKSLEEKTQASQIW